MLLQHPHRLLVPSFLENYSHNYKIVETILRRVLESNEDSSLFRYGHTQLLMLSPFSRHLSCFVTGTILSKGCVTVLTSLLLYHFLFEPWMSLNPLTAILGVGE